MNGGADLALDLIIAVECWREEVGRPKHIVFRSAQAAFQAGVQSRGRDAEASVRLTNDAEILALNSQYRNKAEPTNILSFPALNSDDLDRLPDGAPLILGDLIIALETTLLEAKAEAKTPEDHLSHLVVHGMLHLLGYDHQTENEASVMENLEVDVLKKMGISNPYCDLENPVALI